MIRLLRNEDGTAMTEFIMFLPIFIVCFIGVGNLITAGIGVTKVEMLGQRDLWSKAIPISNDTGAGAAHLSPLSAGATAFGEFTDLASNGDNPQQVADGIEGTAFNVGLGGAGHWGESFERAIIPKTLTYANNIDDLTFLPSDIIGNRMYPNLLLNDSASSEIIDTGASGSSGALSVGTIIQGLISGSGFIPSMAAGIRYGVVFGEAEDDFQLMAGGPTKHYESHHDVLVPPHPLEGMEHRTLTFGAAWGSMIAQEEYRVMLRYGKSEWEGGFDDGRTDAAEDAYDSEYDENYDEELEEKCAEIIAAIPRDEDGNLTEDPPDECD